MKKTVIVILTLLIVGCATPYQSTGFWGDGYSETRLDHNVFKVHFHGNSETSKERAINFTLLRSAELTLENGYNYFVIIDENSYTQTSTYTTPITATSNTTTYGFGTAHTNTNFSGGNAYTISKPYTANTIICYKEKPSNVFSYNAKFIVDSLRNKYNIDG